jgi:hypothetical protein
MADWKRLAKALALADGRIGDRETAALRRELLGDNSLDRTEFSFLIELKREAKEVSPSFNHLFLQILKKMVMRDGAIDDAEARWLRQWILRDGKITPDEKALLQSLRQEARVVSKEFMALYNDAMKA